MGKLNLCIGDLVYDSTNKKDYDICAVRGIDKINNLVVIIPLDACKKLRIISYNNITRCSIQQSLAIVLEGARKKLRQEYIK